MTESAATHYDRQYFSWQESIGRFGGWANSPKFSEYVGEGDTVLDFGCGGGFLLQHLACANRIGVEVNAAAVAVAVANGIAVYDSVSAVPDNCVDVVISNHALEHVQSPFDALCELHKKLRQDGLIVVVVPCESISYRYKPNDRNHHLYSWSPMCLGNLLTDAGFELIESKAFVHKWPPGYRWIARLGGRMTFEVACRLYGRVERSWFQVRAVGRRHTA